MHALEEFGVGAIERSWQLSNLAHIANNHTPATSVYVHLFDVRAIGELVRLNRFLLGERTHDQE